MSHRHSDSWLTATGPDVRFAQQFWQGDQSNIDQVTIPLFHPQASAKGNLRFELWRDNGSNQPVPVDDPTGKIADLGKILNIEDTVPVGELGEFTFDNLILGLEPNQPYWIVTDYSEVRDIGGGPLNVGVLTPYEDPSTQDPTDYDATAGTNGATYLHAYRDENPPNPNWGNLRDIFGLTHYYQAMKVEAMETITPQTVSLFDTLDRERNPDHDILRSRAWAFSSEERLSQPFLTGDHNNVASVTVDVDPRGNPAGSFNLEVWSDDGNGTPGSLVGVVGTIDANSLQDDVWQFIKFDEQVIGLQPNSNYHLVWNNDNAIFTPTDSVDLPVTGNLDGTNGAGLAVVWDSETGEWCEFTDICGTVPFDGDYRFIQMTIEAQVASAPGDLNHSGDLDPVEIDIVSSAIRQGLTDSQYDVNIDDQVNSADRVVLAHDLANTYFGDSNLDAEFNSSDLTAVFQAGEYEDNITLNSTWAEGDWNGDGDFDTTDLVTAFQDGGYERGPRADAQAVPEPSSMFVMAIGLIGVRRMRGSSVDRHSRGYAGCTWHASHLAVLNVRSLYV